MDRYWLLTSTTYGTWLPGDDRGFVSRVRVHEGPEVKHNLPGTACESKMRGLAMAARESMSGPPVFLSLPLAEPLQQQFLETATYRGWRLIASAIMANHFHLVVGVLGDPEPEKLLQSFKSYGSRTLNRIAGKPTSETWWTASGSRRKLPDAHAVRCAVRYVLKQHRPLLVWVDQEYEREFLGNEEPESGSLESESGNEKAESGN